MPRQSATPKPEPKRAGECVVNLPVAYGVDLVSGIPGRHHIELCRGLSQSGITHVLTVRPATLGDLDDALTRGFQRPTVTLAELTTEAVL